MVFPVVSMDVRAGPYGNWTPKNWWFWTVVLEKTLESPLNCKEIKLVCIKGNQPWIFIERTHTEAEAPRLWPLDAKNWLIGKDPGAGKDWWQEEKEKAEDEMVGWHHQLDGHEFEQAPGNSGGQGSLMCCSPWGLKQLDMTEWLKLREAMMCYVHNIGHIDIYAISVSGIIIHR